MLLCKVVLLFTNCRSGEWHVHLAEWRMRRGIRKLTRKKRGANLALALLETFSTEKYHNWQKLGELWWML